MDTALPARVLIFPNKADAFFGQPSRFPHSNKLLWWSMNPKCATSFCPEVLPNNARLHTQLTTSWRWGWFHSAGIQQKFCILLAQSPPMVKSWANTLSQKWFRPAAHQCIRSDHQASKSHRLASFTRIRAAHSLSWASYVSGSGCLPRTKKRAGDFFSLLHIRSHELANEINEGAAGGAKALAPNRNEMLAMLWQLQQWASFLSINGMKLEKISTVAPAARTHSIRLRKC